jgi:tetratricopeptide (TPR) repeat protein
MELMELESMFCIGNYQYVINEATNPQLLSHLTKEQVLKAKVLLHRAYLAHGRYNLVIQEIQPNDPDALIAVQLLAMYLASSEARPDIIAQLRVIATQAAPNPCLAIVLATTFMLHGDYHKALELVTMFDRDLECCLMQVQLLCLICRPDLARNQLMALKGISIDSVMTQLAEQWIGMFTGEPGKYEDAYYAFEELITTNKATYKLLASKGVCLLHSGRYEEAYTLLTDALTHVSFC